MSPLPPFRGGVTDSNREKVRSCADVSVGRLGVWWKFRHSDTSNDGCPCYNSGTDHYRSGNHDGGIDYDCCTHTYDGGTDYDCSCRPCY